MARTTSKQGRTIIDSSTGENNKWYIDDDLGIDSEVRSGKSSEPYRTLGFAIPHVIRNHFFDGPDAEFIVVNALHQEPTIGYMRLNEWRGTENDGNESINGITIIFGKGNTFSQLGDIFIDGTGYFGKLLITVDDATDSQTTDWQGNGNDLLFVNFLGGDITVFDTTFTDLDITFSNCRKGTELSNIVFPPFFDSVVQFVDSSVLFINCEGGGLIGPNLEDDSYMAFVNCKNMNIQGDITISGTSTGTSLINTYFRLENCEKVDFIDDDLIFDREIVYRPLLRVVNCHDCEFNPDFIRKVPVSVQLQLNPSYYWVNIRKSYDIRVYSSTSPPFTFDSSLFDQGLQIDDLSSIDSGSGGPSWTPLDLSFSTTQVNDIAPGAWVEGYRRYPSYVDDTAAGVGGLTTGQPFLNTTIGALTIKS